MRFVEARLSVPNRVTEWRGAKWSRSACIWSCKALFLSPSIATTELRTTWAIVVATSLGLCQTMNQTGQLLLHDRDALLDNGIWFKVPSTLHFVVKLIWDGIVVERLTLLARLLEVGVLAPWPEVTDPLLVSRVEPRYRVCESILPLILSLGALSFALKPQVSVA